MSTEEGSTVGMELQRIAMRMGSEMPLKERIIHLQAFKYTFQGHQAVSFLVSKGLYPSEKAAIFVCQQLLHHGWIKSIHHKDVFLPDNELYRFPSSMMDTNKHKGLPSLTSTGFYKEIAKFGKAAAQPFKDIQTSLNDTFATLGSLSVAPKLSNMSNGVGSSPLAVRRHNSRSAPVRRTQSVQLEKQVSTPRTQDTQDSNASLIAELRALHAAVKESTSLVRLDLQQHTALQEHLVGLLRMQQSQLETLQMLGTVVAMSASLSLVALGGTWPLLGCSLLAVVLFVIVPRSLDISISSVVTAWARARASVSTYVGAGDQLIKRQTSRALSELGGAEASAADQECSHFGSAAGSDSDLSSDDDERDWYEAGPVLQDFDNWPDQPVMLCPDPAISKQVFQAECHGLVQALPVNSIPIPFESELFKGVIVVYIRHLPTTPSHLFKGRKRLNWVAFQGQFKRPVCMDSLVYGQEFSHKLCNLPAPWFIDNMLLPLARKISPALRVGSLDHPYMYSPLITASQIVNVSLPGQAPDIMEAKEDSSLLMRSLGYNGEVWTVSGRRKHFQSAANRLKCPFSPDYVWTFHLWQEYIDFASYMLNLSYSSYDLAQHLDGQPLQVMVKDVSCSTYLVNLHVWHRNLVQNDKRIHTLAANRAPCDSREEPVTGRSAYAASGGAGGSCSTSQPCSPNEVMPSMFTSDAGNQPQQKLASAAAQHATAGAARQPEREELPQQDVAGRGASSAEYVVSGSSAAPTAPEGSPELWFEAWHSKPKAEGDEGYPNKTGQSVLLCSAVAADVQQSAPSNLLSHRGKVLQSLVVGTTSASTGGREQADSALRDSLDARSRGSCSVTEAASHNAAWQLKTMRSL